MLKELKVLLSSEVASLMQETKLTQLVMQSANSFAQKNIDLKAAVDESACNEQGLDESFEVLL